MENIYTKVNNLYNKKGFFEKYGADVWISVIIILIFFLIISYYHIINNIKPIIADWTAPINCGNFNTKTKKCSGKTY